MLLGLGVREYFFLANFVLDGYEERPFLITDPNVREELSLSFLQLLRYEILMVGVSDVLSVSL